MTFENSIRKYHSHPRVKRMKENATTVHSTFKGQPRKLELEVGKANWEFTYKKRSNLSEYTNSAEAAPT